MNLIFRFSRISNAFNKICYDFILLILIIWTCDLLNLCWLLYCRNVQIKLILNAWLLYLLISDAIFSDLQQLCLLARGFVGAIIQHMLLFSQESWQWKAVERFFICLIFTKLLSHVNTVYIITRTVVKVLELLIVLWLPRIVKLIMLSVSQKP